MRIREAINIIDNNISASLSDRRWVMKQYGLGKISLINDRDDKRFPVIVTPTQQETAVIDDRYNMITYHVQQSTTYEEGAQGFGSDDDDMKRIDTIMMIVYGDVKRLNMAQESLTDIISTLLPKNIDQGVEGLFSQVVDVKSINTNSTALFTQQYQGSDIQLPPDKCFIGVMYTITSDYAASCIEVCSTC